MPGTRIVLVASLGISGSSDHVWSVNEMSALFDETVVPVHAWIARIAGGEDVAHLVSETYARFFQSADRDADRPDQFGRLMAHGLRAALDRHEGPLPPPADRALIELLLVRSVPGPEAALIVGGQPEDLSASLAEALERTGLTGDVGEADNLLRQGEDWLDDHTRETCLSEIIAASSAAIVDQVPSSAARSANERRMRDRRLGPRQAMAVSAAVGALIVGLIAVWLKPDRQPVTDARPTPFTTPVAAGTTTTTSPVLDFVTWGDPQYVLADSPDGFGNFGVITYDTPVSADSWLQIWADHDASRTSGRWFAIVLARCATSQEGLQMRATRTVINDHAGLLSNDQDGRSRLVVQLEGATGSQTLEVTSFGLDTATIESIASSVILAPAQSTCGTGRTPDPIDVAPGFETLTAGMTPVVSQQVAASRLIDVAGQSVLGPRGVAYSGDFSSPPVVLVSAPAGDDARLRDMVNRFASPGGPTKTGKVFYEGRAVTVTEQTDTLASPTTTSVAWTQDGLQLTLSGELPSEQLLSLIGGVHRASPEEWHTLITAPQTTPLIVPDDPATTVAPHPKVANVGASTSSDGRRWQLLVTPGLGTLRVQSVNGSSSDTPYALDPAKPIVQFDQADATILVIVLPGDRAGQTVQASVAGGTLPPVTLTQPELDAPAFAIVAVNETGPSSIHLVDAAGRPGSELRNSS